MPERRSHDRQEVHSERNRREQTSLEEVAKGLASGAVSRRKALRLAQRPAQAQDFCPNPAEACCTCRYRERGSTETFRSKCLLLPTRRCGRRPGHELFERCQELCEENRPRRLRTQSVSVTCREGENSDAVCERVPTGTECNFLECTQPAGVTVENIEGTGSTL